MALKAEPGRKLPGSTTRFAVGGKRFPIGDKKHDRLAISGATRSEHAGNISESTEAKIKAEARHDLHRGVHKAPKKTAFKGKSK